MLLGMESSGRQHKSIYIQASLFNKFTNYQHLSFVLDNHPRGNLRLSLNFLYLNCVTNLLREREIAVTV